jgi:hypothetical protein
VGRSVYVAADDPLALAERAPPAVLSAHSFTEKTFHNIIRISMKPGVSPETIMHWRYWQATWGKSTHWSMPTLKPPLNPRIHPKPRRRECVIYQEIFMRELNTNEVDAVSGGIWQFFAGWAAGHALDWSIEYVANGEVQEDTFSNPQNAQNVFGA